MTVKTIAKETIDSKLLDHISAFAVLPCFILLLTFSATAQKASCSVFDTTCRIKEATDLISADKSRKEVFLTRGFLYSSQGDHNEAIADLSEFITDNNDRTDLVAKAYAQRASSYNLVGQDRLAVLDYTNAISISPKNTSLLFARALLYARDQDYDRAIADLTAAFEIDPRYSQAVTFRGNMYLRKKDRKRAFADFNKAIELDPNNGDAYFNRAFEYASRKEHLKSIADYSKYLTLNAKFAWTFAPAYFNRSLVYEEAGDKVKALQDLNAAIDIMPSEPKYLLARASYYRRQNMKSEAEADEKRAEQLRR